MHTKPSRSFGEFVHRRESRWSRASPIPDPWPSLTTLQAKKKVKCQTAMQRYKTKAPSRFLPGSLLSPPEKSQKATWSDGGWEAVLPPGGNAAWAAGPHWLPHSFVCLWGVCHIMNDVIVVCGFLYHHINTHFCSDLFQRSRNESREEGRQKRFIADKYKKALRKETGEVSPTSYLYSNQGKAELLNEFKTKTFSNE